MSTSYYRLKSPVTSIRVDFAENPRCRRISIWINGERSGALIVKAAELQPLLQLFVNTDVQVLHTYSGGSEIGVVVTVNAIVISDDDYVISEYGELFTVRQVKARAGEGATKCQRGPT